MNNSGEKKTVKHDLKTNSSTGKEGFFLCTFSFKRKKKPRNTAANKSGHQKKKEINIKKKHFRVVSISEQQTSGEWPLFSFFFFFLFFYFWVLLFFSRTFASSRFSHFFSGPETEKRRGTRTEKEELSHKKKEAKKRNEFELNTKQMTRHSNYFDVSSSIWQKKTV